MTRNKVPVAIIGMSGRFPHAPDLDQFWSLLRDGKHVMERVPDFMLDARRDANGDLPPRYVPVGTFLENTEYFDCGLFGLSRREAMMLDPQQRLFIEHSYLATENAGYDISKLGHRVGVYSGAGPSRHALDALEVFGHDSATMFEVIAMGIDKPMSMRVSHLFDLRGESLYVYAACATSLVAVDLAVNSIVEGRVDAAIAGASCLYLPQMEGYDYVEGAVRSSDGLCRAFDASADGTVWGNGVGVVVLKRLDRALADGDLVRAIILGSSVNNDGASKASFAAPSSDGQAEVIKTAMARAGVKPEDIDFIEAHGTGTPVGDPIEVASLNRAFGKARGPKTCVLGSVKTNIGHLDPAAGVAGLIKTVLALENETIPATVHFHTPNPQIDFDSGPFVVSGEARPWNKGERLRLAGVNSFGVGGTNAHLIVSEPCASAPREPSRRGTQFVTLSARTETALEQSRTNLQAYLARNSTLDLRDVAFTRNVGRKHFRHCIGVLAESLSDLCNGLTSARAFSRPTKPPAIAFVFPGQGSQVISMGAALYESEPIFRDAFDHCSRKLAPLLGIDIRDVVFPESDNEIKAGQLLLSTAIQQPILFSFSWSLSELLTNFGVKADTYIGHSVGEFVAAVCAGTMTMDAALRILAARGAAMQKCASGRMLACSADASSIASLIPSDIDVAAVNAPHAVVLAGPESSLDTLCQTLDAQGIRHTKLATSHAFHSRYLRPAVNAVRQAISKETLTHPKQRWYSTISGRLIDESDAVNPDFWAEQLVKPVRFEDAVRGAITDGVTLFVELGGRTVLKSAIELTAFEAGHPEIEVVSVSNPDAGCFHHIEPLWRLGVEVDWTEVHRDDSSRRVSLPTTPLEGVWVALTKPGETPRPATFPRPGFSEPGPPSGAILKEGNHSTAQGEVVVGTIGTYHANSFEAQRSARPKDLLTPYTPPSSQIEMQVAEIYGRTLSVDGIGADDNLFDLGGTSLMLVHVVNFVRDKFDVNLPIRVILENPTPRTLANAISDHLKREGGEA